jgi:hypothetical protein
MTRAAATVKRNFHRPIMRQVQRAPATVVEISRRRARAIAGLGEVGEKIVACIEITGGIRGMAESESPTEIHQQPFPPGGGRGILCLGVWSDDHREKDCDQNNTTSSRARNAATISLRDSFHFRGKVSGSATAGKSTKFTTRQSVAQIFNLPYRRFVICRA